MWNTNIVKITKIPKKNILVHFDIFSSSVRKSPCYYSVRFSSCLVSDEISSNDVLGCS